MGGQESLAYAIPVTEKPAGETAIFRNPICRESLIDWISPNFRTIKDSIIASVGKYGHLNCLGKIVKNMNESSIEYITYKSMLANAQKIGSGILHLGLESRRQEEPMHFVGMYCKNRPEWTILDVACILFNIVSIPISDTLGDENITYVLNHTGLTSIFVNDIGLKGLAKTKDLCKISTIICMDTFSQEQVAEFAKRNVKVIHYLEVQTQGELNPRDYTKEEFLITPESCLTFSYTSGTTGPPKGAMISHKNFVSFVAACENDNDCHFNSKDVHLSYLPLQHILEREVELMCLSVGATIVFYSGDIVNGLKEDLAIVKPTFFVSVPRLYSRFHDAIKHKFNEVSGISRAGLDHAISVKIKNMHANGGVTHKVYDPIFFEKTKQALGGRVRMMISGSAPLLPEVQEFMKMVICAPLCEGYGQTESTGASFITAAADGNLRHVGGPTTNIEYKLVDIPEMSYLSTDKDEEGNPSPRGEIWLRGPGVFIGYYRDEVKTKEAVTEDGWLKTGDVGQQLHLSKALKIIDRKKNIFKLQQGEYVAPEKVENVYLKSPLIAQIFLHGDSTESFVVGVIVPHKRELLELAASLNIEGTFEQLCKNPAIRTELTIRLNQVGKEAKLQSFEQAKNIYLESESLVMKGIVTSTMKVQRHEAKKFYKAVIADLYKEGMLKLTKE